MGEKRSFHTLYVFCRWHIRWRYWTGVLHMIKAQSISPVHSVWKSNIRGNIGILNSCDVFMTVLFGPCSCVYSSVHLNLGLTRSYQLSVHVCLCLWVTVLCLSFVYLSISVWPWVIILKRHEYDMCKLVTWCLHIQILTWFHGCYQGGFTWKFPQDQQFKMAPFKMFLARLAWPC